MRQIREVLRLRFEKNLSERQMAQAIGVGRTTIQGFLKKAAQAQLTWPLPPELNDVQLEKLFFPSGPLKFEKNASRPFPDFLYLHKELKKKGVTLQLLWEEYQQANPQGYQYTQFRVHYRQWEKTLEPVMRQTHKAGEKMFVDYAGMTMGVVDRQTGEVREAQYLRGRARSEQLYLRGSHLEPGTAQLDRLTRKNVRVHGWSLRTADPGQFEVRSYHRPSV